MLLMCSVWNSVRLRLPSLTLFFFYFILHCAPGLAEITYCSFRYGYHLDPRRCELALANVPEGALPRIFTTRANDNYLQVPRRYYDSIQGPACVITVDLEGHSREDVYVLVPWNEIRLIAAKIIQECVVDSGTGGFSTFGVNQSYEAIVASVPYDTSINPVRVRPQEVVNPDGSIETIAVPATQDEGISKRDHLPI